MGRPLLHPTLAGVHILCDLRQQPAGVALRSMPRLPWEAAGALDQVADVLSERGQVERKEQLKACRTGGL